MSVLNDVWAEAPKEATHCTPETSYTNRVYWLFEDGVVKKVWVEYTEDLDGGWHEDQGYSCVDYKTDEQPDYSEDELVARPVEMWIPRVGDTVLYKDRSSLDFAWDAPEEVYVVAVYGASAWINSSRWDMVVDIEHLQPAQTEKTLESRLNEVINPEGWSSQSVSTTVRRLIEAGVEFKD